MTRQAAVSVLLSLFFAQSLTAQAPSEVEVILRPGQALGLDSSSFLFARALARNAAGHMVFLASYCRQAPEVGPCQAEENVFLSDDQAIRPLIDEATRPPGFSLANESSSLFLTNSGRVLLAQRGGVLRFDGDRFRWLVRQGDRAPGTSFQGTELRFQQFRVTERFARENGSVVFGATLSDQSNGVFESNGLTTTRILAEGEIPPGGSDPIAAGALLFAAPKAVGSLTAFVLTRDGRRTLLFLHDGTTLRAVARRGQTLDGVTVESLEAFDLNAAGQLVFVVRYLRPPQVRDARLFMHRDGQIVALTPVGPPAGLVDLPIDTFTGPWVTEFGEVFFGVVQVSGSGGIFCWRAGRLTKIAADGDLGPGGSVLTVTIAPEINIPEPPGPVLANHFVATPRAPGVLAFQARLHSGSSGLTTLVWRSGSLELLDLNLQLLPGDRTRLVDNVLPLDVDASGRVLLRAGVCCGLFQEAFLLTSTPLASRRYLPYLAEGDFPSGISFQSQLRSWNAGPYTALYESALIRDPQPATPTPSLRTVQGGLTDELRFHQGPGAGFLRIDTVRGGPLGFYGLIQLIRNGFLASETTVEAQNPITDGGLVVDSSRLDRVGLAVSNPRPSPLAVDWELLDDSGQSVASGVIDLAGEGQSAQFVDELAPNVAQPFLGWLRLRAGQPFLAVGLRLSGLQLSTIPVASPTGPQSFYGFERVVETRPFPDDEDQPSQFLLGPNDEQAWVSQDGQLRLAGGDGLRVLFGLGHPLTEATFSETTPSHVSLVEFGPAGLLFTVSPAIGRPGLFLWDGTEARRLVRSGEPLPSGVGIALGFFPETFAINDSGEIALGINGLFRRRPDGMITPIFLHDDPLAGGGTYGETVGVDINESGAIGFATSRVVGLADASGPRVVARVGEPFGGGFNADRFERVRITSDGHLYFTATGRESFNTPQPTLAPVSGLFFFDGQTVRPMLRTGAAVPPGGQVVDQVEFSRSPSFPSPIRLNRRDQLAAFASLRRGEFGEAGGFFLLANTTASPRLLVADFRVDPRRPLRVSSSFTGFGWNDDGELLFPAELPDLLDGLFKLRTDGQLDTVLLQGDRLDDSDGGEPEAARSLSNVWDLSNRGAAAFDALGYPTLERATYLARPNGFRQLWVPQVAVGDFGGLEFSSSLLIHNLGAARATVSLDVFSPSGRHMGEFPDLELSPDATSRVDLDFPEATAGWARLQIRGGSEMTAFLRMSLRGQNGPLSELTVPAVPAGRDAIWRAGAHSILNRDTGLAVVNTSHSEAEIAIQRLGAGGIPVDVRRFSLPALGYRAILLTDLFPDQSGGSDGVYRISSSNLIALFSLEQFQGRVTGVPIARGRGIR